MEKNMEDQDAEPSTSVCKVEPLVCSVGVTLGNMQPTVSEAGPLAYKVQPKIVSSVQADRPMVGENTANFLGPEVKVILRRLDMELLVPFLSNNTARSLTSELRYGVNAAHSTNMEDEITQVTSSTLCTITDVRSMNTPPAVCSLKVTATNAATVEDMDAEVDAAEEGVLAGATTMNIAAGDLNATRAAVIEWGDHQLLCSYCNYSFISKLDYTRHMKRKHARCHRVKLYLCPKCPFVGASWPLTLHVHCHSLSSALKCSHCSYLTNTMVQLKSHVQTCRYAHASGISFLDIEQQSSQKDTPRLAAAEATDAIIVEDVVIEDITGEDVTVDNVNEDTTVADVIDADTTVADAVNQDATVVKPIDEDAVVVHAITEENAAIENISREGSVADFTEKDYVCENGTIDADSFNTSTAETASPDASTVKTGDAICSSTIGGYSTDWKSRQVHCKYCSYSFISELDYNKHMKKKHARIRRMKIHFCQKCPFASPLIEFRRHMRYHSSPKAVKCPYCPTIVKKKSALAHHLNSCRFGSANRSNQRTGLKDVTYPIAEDALVEATSTDAACITDDVNDTAMVDAVEVVSTVATSVKDTVRDATTGKVNTGKTSTVSDVTIAEAAAVTEWGNHRLICKYCNYMFESKLDYLRHMKKEHIQRSRLELHLCPKCPFVSGPGSFFAHLACHSLPKPFKCPYCHTLGKKRLFIEAHLRKCRFAHVKDSTEPLKPTALKDVTSPVAEATMVEPTVPDPAHVSDDVDDTTMVDTSTTMEVFSTDVTAARDSVSEAATVEGTAVTEWGNHQLLCTYCRYSFQSKLDYSRHMTKKHGEHRRRKLYLCPTCPFVSHFTEFLKHMHNHSLPQTAKCPYCPTLLRIKNGLKRHVTRCRYAHAHQVSIAKNLVELESSKSALQQTASKHKTYAASVDATTTVLDVDHDAPIDISETDATAAAAAEWRNHQLLCGHCNYSFQSKSDYKKHMKKKHTRISPLKLYLCQKCPFVSDLRSFLKHMLYHSLSTAVKCPYCPTLVKTINVLGSHLKSCRVMYAAATTSIELQSKKDTRQPTALKALDSAAVVPTTAKDDVAAWGHHQLNCSHCDYSIKSQSDYAEHMKEEHPGFPRFQLHLCPKCPFVAQSYGQSSAHHNRHLMPSAVKCPHCPYLVQYKCHLKPHLQKCQYTWNVQNTVPQETLMPSMTPSQRSDYSGRGGSSTPDQMKPPSLLDPADAVPLSTLFDI